MRVVPEISSEYIRELLHNRYLIVYRILTNQDEVEIVRFWHSARGTLELK